MQVLQAEQISFLFQRFRMIFNKVAAAVNKRAKEGKRFSIIAVAEGAISKEQAALSKKEYKKYIATRPVSIYLLRDWCKDF